MRTHAMVGPLRLVVTMLVLLVHAESFAEEAGSKRDLRLYERAGPYLLPDKIQYTEDGSLIVASIRDFLWRHWREHRLGILITETYSTEGLPARTTYFVEPDSSGAWRILIESRVTLPGINSGTAEHFQEMKTSTAYSVRRAEWEAYTGGPSKDIPSKQLRDAMSYRLVLEDREGKLVARL